MTKTYNDVDAVTRLLEEKERDLELAARIGQSLLDQNKDLRQRNEQLEQDLIAINDTVTQLKHDLSVKNGLLQIYTQDLETDSEAGSPLKEKGFIINWDILNKKISALQEENMQLRVESTMRTSDIEKEEKKEMLLISDCVKQLGEANVSITALQEEIARKSEDNIRQQEEITQLLSQVVDLQRRVRDLTADNEVLQQKLLVTEECQHELSVELIDFKEKYSELMTAFQELQNDLKKTNRPHHQPNTLNWQSYPYGSYVNSDSIASEIELTFGRDSDGYSSDEKMSQSRKVFDTVKYGSGFHYRRSPRSRYNSHYKSSSGPSPISSQYSLNMISSSCQNENQISDSESAYADSYHTDDDGQYSSLGSFRSGTTTSSNSLDMTIRRLSSGIASGTDLSSDVDGEGSNERCWTPDLFSGQTVYNIRPVKHYHIPEKLQIIKPLEGSQTLQHWQKLATPHLGGLFETHPGVQVKGECKIEKKEESFTLDDFEEDDDYSHPGKSFMNTTSVYTYTTSLILHPNDQTRVTPSYPSLQLATRIISQPPSALNSPQQQQYHRERATSTFSTTLGLAKLLNERGIHAMVPTAVIDRNKIASPTPTPAPSPEGSPPSTPLPSFSVKVPDLIGSSSIARGIHLLKKSRKIKKQPSGEVMKPTDASSEEPKLPVITRIGLLDKLNRIGLENIMSTDSDSNDSLKVSARSTNIPPQSLNLSNGNDLAGDISESKSEAKASQTVLSVDPNAQLRKTKTTASSSSDQPPNVLSNPWGYVPPMGMVKSPAAMGLSTALAPPLSRMPNPMLQLNSLRGLRPNSPDVGTVGTLRTLRKGGYI